MILKSFILKKGTLLAVNSILSFFVLVLALVIMRDILSGTSPAKRSELSVSDVNSALSRVKDFDDYAVILQNNPFGFDAGKLTPLTTLREKSAQPVDKSGLKLIGTIASGTDNSFAIFLQSNGKQSLYRVKDMIPGLGILETIESQKVWIRDQEKLVEFALVEIKGKKYSSAITRRGRDRKEIRGQKEEFVKKGSDGSYVLNAKMVQDSINNPQRLMTDARLMPRYIDGEQNGFILKEVKRGGIYYNLGLRNGDVLLRVNEYDITNPESALQAFTALKGVDKLQLDIIRDNISVTQTYFIR